MPFICSPNSLRVAAYSQKHYSQWPKGGNDPGVHQQMNGEAKYLYNAVLFGHKRKHSTVHRLQCG